MTARTSATETHRLDSTTKTFPSRGINCTLHTWDPRSFSPESGGQIRRLTFGGFSFSPKNAITPRGVVVIYHGFAAHSRFPTIRYVAELLCQSNYIVYGLDLPGHGLSPGKRGYVRSSTDLIHHGVNAALYAKKQHPDLPLFLAGVSMGGAIAIAVAAECHNFVDGMILLAPMISIEVSCLHKLILRGLTKVVPKKGLFPAAEDAAAKQFRDPDRRAEVLADELSYSGSLRVSSAQACLNLSNKVKKVIPTVSCPFLCVIANEDVVVDNEGAMELVMRSISSDKTVKAYDALHGLLCEVQPLRGEIESDIVLWLDKRTDFKRNLMSHLRLKNDDERMKTENPRTVLDDLEDAFEL